MAGASASSARILLVDDEQSVQTLLTYPLRKEGYEVVPAHDGREALDRFAEQRFDLVVLDIMLPKLDGIEVCRRMRSRSQVPIIMLTAKDDEIDKVLGLEMGADDYITKPFSVREFRSRVRAALRRAEMIGSRPGGEEPIAAGGLKIDFERRVVTVRRKRADLTYVEFRRARCSSSRSGETPPTGTRAPSTSTFATFGRSSSGTRAPPSTCSRCAASAIASATRTNREPGTEGRLIGASVRNRLAILFFLITAAAVGFIYLYVVPQLRSNLTAQKLQRLEDVATAESARLDSAMRHGASQAQIRRLARDAAQRSDARVTILGVKPGSDGSNVVVVDSQLKRTAILPSSPAATAAVSSGQVSSATEEIDGERTGEIAVPISVNGNLRWVAVSSTPLGDVDDTVALIRRQILIAGGIALILALAAGWFAARAHAKRLNRLEEAAQKVAEGDFSTPIPDEGTDEVGQLAATFNEMQQRLARLDGARKEFIANASHELRTPIFSLGGFVELLDEDEPDPAVRAEFVRTMREQIARLTKLTADLLDLSKLDADVMEVSADEVDLASVAHRVADEFGPAAEQHSTPVEVDADGAATAMADADRVAQIIRILLDNALTHTPEGTSISISTQRRDGSASLVVADNGPGLGPHNRDRVFDRFYTGDRVSGSGLGLAIARELAMRMQGELAVESGRGRTRFELRLPGAAPGGVPA